MMLRFIFSVVFALAAVIFFEQIQNLLLYLSLSWTFSMLFPYLLTVAAGVLLVRTWRKLKIQELPKLTLGILLFFIPFSISFVLHPIYREDFQSVKEKVHFSPTLNQFKKTDLVIFTIPGCPFCLESCHKMNRLAKRNPSLRIKYIVLNSNPESITEFRKVLNPAIRVERSEDIQSMLQISGRKFPVFVYLKKNNQAEKWVNSAFGYPALDEIEAY